MYASVRHHWLEEEVVEEILTWVREEFVQTLRGLTGFRFYYGIDGGDGHLIFVSAFDSKMSAEQAHEWAMEHAETTWGSAARGMARETVGKIVVAENAAT